MRPSKIVGQVRILAEWLVTAHASGWASCSIEAGDCFQPICRVKHVSQNKLFRGAIGGGASGVVDCYITEMLFGKQGAGRGWWRRAVGDGGRRLGPSECTRWKQQHQNPKLSDPQPPALASTIPPHVTPLPSKASPHVRPLSFVRACRLLSAAISVCLHSAATFRLLLSSGRCCCPSVFNCDSLVNSFGAASRSQTSKG